MRNALHSNHNVDKEQYAYLLDLENVRNSYQIGKKIGRTFGWRMMRYLEKKPEWDDSLDTH
jgi:hypothetical protein